MALLVRCGGQWCAIRRQSQDSVIYGSVFSEPRHVGLATAGEYGVWGCAAGSGLGGLVVAAVYQGVVSGVALDVGLTPFCSMGVASMFPGVGTHGSVF